MRYVVVAHRGHLSKHVGEKIFQKIGISSGNIEICMQIPLTLKGHFL